MSRDKILSNIGDIIKPLKDIDLDIDRKSFNDKVATFKQMLQVAGGRVVEVNSLDISTIKSYFLKNKNIIDTTKQFTDTQNAISGKEYDITIIEAKFGVAENGAVWIEWNDRYPRSLITLSEALAIILRQDNIYETMQEAYNNIDFEDISYGLFLSGPSKTADIEQSLVFGAHGAVELTIFLI